MSRESRQLSPLEELGAIVSLEHADCSIAAAEAYQLAHQELRSTKDTNEILYAISPDLDPSQRQGGALEDLYKAFSYNGEVVRLQLLQPKVRKVVSQRQGILRKTVELVSADPYGDPMLIARIGEDTYLPLASFALREGSDNCAYVQIGPEMRDDTAVVTSLDENTPRHAIVEAIRSLMEEQHMSDHSIVDPETERIIQTLFSRLIDAQAEIVNKSTELMLVRRAFTKINSMTVGKNFNVLTQDHSTYTESMRFVTLMEEVLMDDGRRVDLCLAKPFKQYAEDPYLHLFAVARGNIAVPIARMHKETGSIVFQNDAGMSSEQRKAIIDSLLARVRERPVIDPNIFETPENYGLRKSSSGEIHPAWRDDEERALNYYDTVSATYFYEKGLLRKDEGALKDGKYSKSGTTEWDVNSMYEQFDTYFADPENNPLPHADLAPVKLAMSRLPIKQAAERSIFNLLDVDKDLRDTFGECYIEEERLAAQIAAMTQRGNVFEGVYEKVRTPNTVGDIAVRVTISRSATNYEVKIYAKPQAMTNRDFPKQPQMLLVFDAAGKVIERRDGVNVDEEARKYFEILRDLIPITEKTTSK
jgi:hypothetical protein